MKNENKELTCLTSFFQAFAERAYKENDLSDVTYALCRSDVGFMKFFLKFFFGARLQPNDVKVFEREHSEDMGRPDFWIETKTGEVYIVEVKIGDGHQHFHDYNKLLKKHLHLRRENQAWDHLGYIANYKVTTTEKGKSLIEESSNDWVIHYRMGKQHLLDTYHPGRKGGAYVDSVIDMLNEVSTRG